MAQKRVEVEKNLVFTMCFYEIVQV